ncbi:hypothetical protein B0H14DRAFT_2655417 [Mycena olivaceomarginata]|nr:hypothetical protein B0H14DRAFT_2655417 [Mycena olivaceomarginata]
MPVLGSRGADSLPVVFMPVLGLTTPSPAPLADVPCPTRLPRLADSMPVSAPVAFMPALLADIPLPQTSMLPTSRPGDLVLAYRSRGHLSRFHPPLVWVSKDIAVTTRQLDYLALGYESQVIDVIVKEIPKIPRYKAPLRNFAAANIL